MNEFEKKFATLSLDEDLDLDDFVAAKKDVLSQCVDFDPEEAQWLEAEQREIDAQLDSFDPIDETKLAAAEKSITTACRDPLLLKKPGFKCPFKSQRSQGRKKTDDNADDAEQKSKAGVSSIYMADPVLEGLTFNDEVAYATKDKEWLETAQKHFVEVAKLTSERRGRILDPESLFHPSRANDNPSYWHAPKKVV